MATKGIAHKNNHLQIDRNLRKDGPTQKQATQEIAPPLDNCYFSILKKSSYALSGLPSFASLFFLP